MVRTNEPHLIGRAAFALTNSESVAAKVTGKHMKDY